MSDNTPDLSGQMRSIAQQFISGDALESFVTYAPADAFTTADGNIDEEKVAGHLTAIFATRQQPKQWGQYSATGGPSKQPGDDARAALEKRHGIKNDAPQLDQPISRGATARAALDRRHPRRNK